MKYNPNGKPDYKVGDKVTCIRNYGTAINKLVLGAIYIIKNIDHNADHDWLVQVTDTHGIQIVYNPNDPLNSNEWFADRFTLFEKQSTTTSANSPAVNDYVCLSCGNTKCSKQTERTCWKCGGKL